MGFMDDLKARQAQRTALAPPPAAAAPAPEAPAPAPATAPAAAPSTVRELLTQVGAGAAINPPAFEPPAAAASSVIPANSWVGGPSAGGPSAPPPAATAPRRGRGRAKADAPVPPTTAPTTQQVIDTVGTAVGQFAAKSISTPPPAPDAPALKAPGRINRPYSGAMDGYVLCVNCAPMGAEIVMFSRYVGQVHEALKATKGCELYTLLGFEGTALYQDALAQLIDQAPPQGYLVVDTRTNEGRDAISILERGATSVVRGF